MERRKLGNTDLELTTVGLGTWAIGGDGWSYGWGPQDDADSIRCIHEALDAGINWIDTAPIYGLGRSEEVVGKALQESSHQAIVATKCGLVPDKDNAAESCLTPESIVQEVEDSLRRLQRDVIDLYQIHWPNPRGQIDEAWQTVLSLKEQGKIRWAGVSNFSAKQLEQISQFGRVSSLQPPYSLLDRRIEEDSLPWCAEHEVGVIAYSPIQNGILTNRFHASWAADLPDSDWRKTKLSYVQPLQLEKTLAFVDELRGIAAALQVSVSQLAIAWVIQQPGVSAAIVGARAPKQITETLQASAITLGSETLDSIEAASVLLRT